MIVRKIVSKILLNDTKLIIGIISFVRFVFVATAKNKYYFVLTCISIIGFSICNPIFVSYLENGINHLYTFNAQNTYFKILSYLIILSVIKSILEGLSKYFFQKTCFGILLDLQKAMYFYILERKHLITSLDIKHNITSLCQDFEIIKKVINKQLFQLVNHIVTFISFTYIASSVDVKLSLIVLGLILIVIFYYRKVYFPLVGTRLSKIIKKQLSCMHNTFINTLCCENQYTVEESQTQFSLIKLFGRLSFLYKRVSLKDGIMFSFIDLISSLSYVLIVVYFYFLKTQLMCNAGKITVFYLASVRQWNSIKNLLFNLQFQESLQSIGHIYYIYYVLSDK